MNMDIKTEYISLTEVVASANTVSTPEDLALLVTYAIVVYCLTSVVAAAVAALSGGRSVNDIPGVQGAKLVLLTGIFILALFTVLLHKTGTVL